MTDQSKRQESALSWGINNIKEMGVGFRILFEVLNPSFLHEKSSNFKYDFITK